MEVNQQLLDVQAVRIEVEQQHSANLVAKRNRYDWQVASTTKHQISR
jgi:hypothetical protein